MAWYDSYWQGLKAGGSDALDILDPGGTRKNFETATADTSALTDALEKAKAGEAQIANERGRATASHGQQNATREQQVAQLAALNAAANGTAPSAAQIAGQQASDRAAQQQFAMASAIRRNPALAQRAALTGTAASGAQIAQQAANQRAAEQAQARSTLVGATTGIRSGDQAVYATDQSARDANLAAILKQEEINAAAAKDTANANAVSAGATNTKRAGVLSAGGALGASMLSDERSKDAVRDRSMADALAKEVRGVQFEYRPGLGDGPGKHFGVIAQELERAIPGVVEDGGDGFKRVNTGHLTTANTALLSELAKRVKALEGRR